MRLIEHLSAAQLEQLTALYQTAWWTRGRTLQETRSGVAGSTVCLALVDHDDRLQAFCRVLTDGVFKALVFDVIVAPDLQGQGLGQRLMDALLSHPQLQGVKHIELYCLPELQPYYRQWGFDANVGAVSLMRLTRR